MDAKMEAHINMAMAAAMAEVDAAFAQRTEQSRRELLARHDAETVEALMAAGARMWATEREVFETGLRKDMKGLWA